MNVIRAMMSATDRLLKRPAVPLRKMGDIRFLLIILEVIISNTFVYVYM